jgi:hypothetical protein
MYAIEQQTLGFKLVFQGSIAASEMQRWVEDSKAALCNAPPSFGLFMDMRTLQPLPPESQTVMLVGQQLYQRHGMRRSVVIVLSPITRMQFTRLAQESGIHQWERYISAESTPDWESKGWAWIQGGVDPDVS